jgi:hypothetical protein
LSAGGWDAKVIFCVEAESCVYAIEYICNRSSNGWWGRWGLADVHSTRIFLIQWKKVYSHPRVMTLLGFRELIHSQQFIVDIVVILHLVVISRHQPSLKGFSFIRGAWAGSVTCLSVNPLYFTSHSSPMEPQYPYRSADI